MNVKAIRVRMRAHVQIWTISIHAHAYWGTLEQTVRHVSYSIQFISIPFNLMFQFVDVALAYTATWINILRVN